MIAAFRYECRRLATLRSARRVPLAAVLTAAALGLTSALAVSAGAAPGTTSMLRVAASLPILIASILIGASCSGHERHFGMRTVTLAIVPRRARLAIAKATITVFQTAVLGVVGSVTAAGVYSVTIAWAYAGDSTLVPADAVPGPVAAGLAPAAAAAAAAGLLGLAVGWLATWYRTSVAIAVAVVALAMPVAAGWLVKIPDVANALDTAETSLRSTPVLDGLLNPSVLSVWPRLSHFTSRLHPTPPTSLATTALLTAVALVALTVGAVRWQRD
jgi:hypothetical protein